MAGQVGSAFAPTAHGGLPPARSADTAHYRLADVTPTDPAPAGIGILPALQLKPEDGQDLTTTNLHSA